MTQATVNAPTGGTLQPSRRLQSVDSLRLLAITAVIAIHTTPFYLQGNTENTLYSYLRILIDQSARFAVPLFFILAGYFWSHKIKQGHTVKAVTTATLKRVGLALLFWNFLYFIPYQELATHDVMDLVQMRFRQISTDPSLFLFKGTDVHLWFLPSLLWGVFLCAIFMHYGQLKPLIAVSVTLYLIGIAAKAYAETPFGFALDFNTRNGPFFGAIFFATGIILSNMTPNTKWLGYGVAIAAFGFAAHFGEAYILWKHWDIWPSHDYLLGTYFMGCGIALMALSNHAYLSSPALGKAGQYTLGIYGIHMLFVNFLRPFDTTHNSAVWEVGFVVLVLALSYVAIRLLTLIPILKKVLT